ncbi:MAG TPA: hypothetical protein DCG69_11875 [Bacteroidales bacterium]|nr:hypothetical protein [Bacteroidales bacterium]
MVEIVVVLLGTRKPSNQNWRETGRIFYKLNRLNPKEASLNESFGFQTERTGSSSIFLKLFCLFIF